MSRKFFRFEGFTLDLQRLSVQGPLGPVDLRRKSFEVLRYLSENSGRVVTKDELMQAVWPNVTVGDEALPQCISEIRRAIGDENQRIIKTVPRRGYLLDVAVSAGEFAQSSTTMNTASGIEAPGQPDRPSIAVLAFTNMSGDPGQEYLSDGITEDIITELSRFSELFVIARNSTFQYKGRSVDVRQIGRELDVRYVLEGSVRRDGDRIRINAQLIDAVGGAHRWAERYDRKLEDVFLLQDELAHTIVGVLATHVRKAEAERARVKPPSSWLAHDYYMRAADTLNTYQSVFSRDVLRDARRLLEQALAIDPSYARAHAALSLAYTSFWIHRWDEDCPSHVALERAHQSASAAVQLSPNLPEAHVALAWALSWKRQHDAAISEFERAIALNPNFTHWRWHFSMTLVHAGEPARAIENLEFLMRLDPFYEPIVPGTWGFACYMLKRYDEALPYLRECVSRAPSIRPGRQLLAATYAQLGQLDLARAETAELLRIEPTLTIKSSNPILQLKRPQDVEHLRDGLRKAGLPEG